MRTTRSTARTPVGQAIAGWRDEMTARGVRPASISRMTRAVSAACDACGWRFTDQIAYTPAVAWLAEKRRSGAWSGATYDQAVSVLRGFGKYLRRSGVSGANPLEDLLSSREPVGEGSRALTTAEADALVRASLRRHETDRRAKGNAPLFWTFLMATGLRCNEACSCRWGDVSLDAGVIITSAGWSKSRRRDRITLPPAMAHLLAAHARQVPCGRGDLVWPVTPTRATWRMDCVLAGIPDIDHRGRAATMHSCRKSYATWLDAIPGVSAGVVARLTRHASTLTEERYIDHDMRFDADVVARLHVPWPQGVAPLFRAP
jgi:integrase